MKKYSLFLFLIISLQSFAAYVSYSAHEAGRLGDKLLMYSKARWFAYKHNLELLYKPFPYFNQLMLHVTDKHHNQISGLRTNLLMSDTNVRIDRKAKIIYEVRYKFARANWGHYDWLHTFPDIYEDEEFRMILKEYIKPRNPISRPAIPEGRISVAMHVRNGDGFDLPLFSQQFFDYDVCSQKQIINPNIKGYRDVGFPFKHPPEQFYVEQLKQLSELLNNRPLHVHIFTDHDHPPVVLERIKSRVQKDNISYSCREKNNKHDKNVIDDLFAMSEFDCFIRTASNYAQIADLIGNHKLVMYPTSYKWVVGPILIIDDVAVKIKDSSILSATAEEVKNNPNIIKEKSNEGTSF